MSKKSISPRDDKRVLCRRRYTTGLHMHTCKESGSSQPGLNLYCFGVSRRGPFRFFCSPWFWSSRELSNLRHALRLKQARDSESNEILNIGLLPWTTSSANLRQNAGALWLVPRQAQPHLAVAIQGDRENSLRRDGRLARVASRRGSRRLTAFWEVRRLEARGSRFRDR